MARAPKAICFGKAPALMRAYTVDRLRPVRRRASGKRMIFCSDMISLPDTLLDTYQH